MQKKIKVGIIGGAGYTGGELIRVLLNHPLVEMVFVHSKSNAGKALSQVHTDLLGDTHQQFTNTIVNEIDVLFLCVGHGESEKFLAGNNISKQVKCIDLSEDFRIGKNKHWVYGLPELNRNEIKKGELNIANPGCFATCIQLAILPLAHARLLKHDVHVNGITGSTGAGQSLSNTSHFSYRNNNISAYKTFTHQHLKEIHQSIQQLQNRISPAIYFIPNRGCFTRGIYTTLYTKSELSLEALNLLYEKYYATHPFVHISGVPIDLKQVVNTNKCLLYLEKQGDQLLITSAIDNLLKGASGQAVQNMNLLFGIEETTGLKLKATGF
ncbi:MAG: N-acetyl-gamma-glutamyl-phosphate reductase [Bacteroidota bacterium]|nr:N-acetyl-gamma-glutamyl-phosphate reductase [Bacteroidota bacterium]